MLTSGEIEAVSMSMDKSLNALEMRIMEDIVRRIKINGEITRSADWQITRLLQLGMSMKEIENDIKSALDFSDEKMLEMYSNIVSSGYARDKKLYEAVGAAFVPFEQNHELQQLVSAVASQTNSTLKNITQSLGFAVRQPDGKLQFIKLEEYYQKTLDNAMLDITSGAFDYNTVLKRTVKEMTNSGLRTVSYASGWSNRVDVAARRAVMTGMSQITAKINEDNAEALDTDMFEVTWHSGARPEHQVWQGRWYTRKQLETVCGLGTVTGLCGANCYHDYYPVIPGVSEPAYTENELEELNAKENTSIEYNGKQYTKYEALQRQRRLETTMRAQRQEIKLLKEGGADEDDLINARCRYHGTSAEYAKFSQAMGLPQQRERVTVDGLSSIGQGRYTGGSGERSSVQVPPVGAKVVDKVSDQGRLELLKNPLTGETESDIIKAEEIIVKDIDKLENSGMKKDDYNEYMEIIRNHENQDIKRLYNEYADDISSIKLGNDGSYYPGKNSIIFDYPQQRHIDNGMSKYSTLAHEYGHYFDARASFENIHYKEIEAIHENVPFGDKLFKKVPSSSDDFLTAVRMDKEYLRSIGFSKLKEEMYNHDGSSGVQDAISGMFMGDKYVIKWCHREDYYNRTYNNLKDIGKIGKNHSEKHLQSVYKSLGFDASSQAKVKSICRHYETASEMWANIMSAIVCGGDELEYIKKYLPNSYNAMLKILKGVK